MMTTSSPPPKEEEEAREAAKVIKALSEVIRRRSLRFVLRQHLYEM